MTTQDALSVLFITIFLSYASALIASHSSLEKLEYPRDRSMTLNTSDSNWLKNTFKVGWPLGGFHIDLEAKAGILLKSEVLSFRKCYLILIRRQNSSKSFLNSSSFTFFWIRAKSKPLKRIFILASDRTLWLKLKIVVPEQKCPFKQLLLINSVT